METGLHSWRKSYDMLPSDASLGKLIMRIAIIAVVLLVLLAVVGTAVVALLPMKPQPVTIEEEVPASRLPQAQ